MSLYRAVFTFSTGRSRAKRGGGKGCGVNRFPGPVKYGRGTVYRYIYVYTYLIYIYIYKHTHAAAHLYARAPSTKRDEWTERETEGAVYSHTLEPGMRTVYRALAWCTCTIARRKKGRRGARRDDEERTERGEREEHEETLTYARSFRARYVGKTFRVRHRTVCVAAAWRCVFGARTRPFETRIKSLAYDCGGGPFGCRVEPSWPLACIA